MTQRESIAQREAIAQRETTARSLPVKAELFLCAHRSEDSVGQLKCSCANSPPVYTCKLPWCVSTFCTPSVPGKPEEFPPDGPIVLLDGKRVTPGDPRLKGFVVWPIREGEVPTDWQVIACSACGHRTHVDPARQAAMEAGVVGSDAAGKCETLHLFDRSCWDRRQALAGGGGYCLLGAPETWLHAIETVQAVSVVFHVGSLPAATLDAFVEKYPALPIRVELHGKNRFQLCFTNASAEGES